MTMKCPRCGTTLNIGIGTKQIILGCTRCGYQEGIQKKINQWTKVKKK